ncbi:epidermal retinol dehydrogenase 2-like, partial [Thrips palmi]|uniref:Epidermal retinol dehydrogenase 2-like n=1 Tax=Thrips palmi TaxID=161013 RepID=A0A6P8YJW4_THRPL
AAALAVASLALWSWPRGSHNLQGKVVLLTGAGGGLGRLLALHLARRGCVLACADVAAEPNEETVALVHQQQQHKQAARAYTADLTERADIYGLVQKVLEDFGHIDILLSNAGVIQGGALWELSDAQLDLVLDVNLRATMLLVKAVLPHMRARAEGHVVAVSSSTALVPGRGIVAYAASKAGLSRAAM